MATYNLIAPVVAPIVLTSPTSWYSTREALKTQMQKTWNKYGNYFKYYAEASKVPAPILLAFTQIESGGDSTAGGSGSMTQGLMQWNRQYAGGTGNADYTLTKEFMKGRLTQVEKDKLKGFGITFDTKGNTRKITQADLLLMSIDDLKDVYEMVVATIKAKRTLEGRAKATELKVKQEIKVNDGKFINEIFIIEKINKTKASCTLKGTNKTYSVPFDMILTKW